MEPPVLQPLPPLPAPPPEKAPERQWNQYRSQAFIALAERQTVLEANRSAVDLYAAAQMRRVADALNQLGAKFVAVEAFQATRGTPSSPWNPV